MKTAGKPIGLGNVASGLGLTNTAQPDSANNTAIEVADATTAVSGLVAKTGKDLNKVSTVGDLQALAVAGLNFVGNDENSVHKNLGETVTIKGGVNADSSATDSDAKTNNIKAKLAVENIGVYKDGDALVIGLSKNLKGLDSAEFGSVTDASGTKPAISINAKDSNSPSIDFATKDGKGTGTISGLADATKADQAVNKGQLDKMLQGTHTDNGNSIQTQENTPFEYVTKDGQKLVNVNGQFYVKDDPNNFVDGKFQKDTATAVDNSNVIVQAKGNNDNLISVGNVASNIGLNDKDENGSTIQNPITHEAAREALLGKTNDQGDKVGGLYQQTNNLNLTATVGDLQALGMAGLEFVGNDGNGIHRKLGEAINIIGGVSADSSATDSDAKTNNIKAKLAIENIGVYKDGNDLVIGLSKNLKGLNSAEFGSVTDGNGTKPAISINATNSDSPSIDFATKDGKGTGTISGLAKAEKDDQAVNLGQMNEALKGANQAAGDALQKANEASAKADKNAEDISKINGRLDGIDTDLGSIKDQIGNINGQLQNGGLQFEGDDGEKITTKLDGKSTVGVKGGASGNIKVTAKKDEANGGVLEVEMSKDIKVDSVTVANKDGKEAVKVDADDNGGKVSIKDKNGKDAISLTVDKNGKGHINGIETDVNDLSSVVTVKHLNETINNSINEVNHRVEHLDRRVSKLEKNSNAGTASAIAAANLPQPTFAGKSMASVAVGHYEGQQAIAIGVSKVSDSGKWIFKGSVSTNTQRNFGGGVGIGYQW